MGLSIHVSNEETGENLSMNWLRNPYGLCNWAEENYNFQTESKPDDESEQRLWYVVNHWSYGQSSQVDKALFLSVVKRYGDVLLNDLKQGYFFFPERSLEQFVNPHLSLVPDMPIGRFPGVTVVQPEYKVYGLPMEYFAHPCFNLSNKYHPSMHTLQHYQAWFAELVRFAEVLQHPQSVFYCSI